MFEWASDPWKVVPILISIPIVSYYVLPFIANRGSYRKQKTISIFVLGDLGHSPRICYQARSFAKWGYLVNLCGYVETYPPSDIIDDSNIELFPIDAIKNNSGLPYLLFALKKIILQAVQLLLLLSKLKGSDYILIQNPPSVPILVLTTIYTQLLSRNTKIVIDWHNLNYSILNLRYNNLKHPVVRAVKLYERFFGAFAHIHLTVTQMMGSFLTTEFGFDPQSIVVLHDRPADHFQPIRDSSERQAILESNNDLFEDVVNSISEYKIVMSSTSFTPDEDFNILLDALTQYEAVSTAHDPKILLVITGKGPLKQQFVQRVANLDLKKVHIKTAWLSSEEYPKILSIADFGVSLHSSSSGIDLPMKIVDFFGCGVPVVSLTFPAISELVKDGVNGIIVTKNDSASMLEALMKLLKNQHLLNTLREGAFQESTKTWDENWDRHMKKRFVM